MYQTLEDNIKLAKMLAKLNAVKTFYTVGR